MSREIPLSKGRVSGAKGVSWHKGASKWMAMITVFKKPIYLGLFSSIDGAIKARAAAASRFHGEFARA